MQVRDGRLDGGKAFGWGRTSAEYARYRDIYPPVFYEKIAARGLCAAGQRVLDLGTGTGVLPRGMYRYGAQWVGVDLSPRQIEQARRLSAQQDMDIRYLACAAEELDFPPASFDGITACQCFWYFDHKRVAPRLARMLKPGGNLLVLYMAWLPREDAIAGASEALVLKYSPQWSGAGERMHPIEVEPCVLDWFAPVYHEEYLVAVPFTRESWHGRMKACRGVGASLPPDRLAAWERSKKHF